MASEAHAPHGHHVTSVATYIKVWGALMVLTVLTVAVTYVDLGPLNMVLAMGIATIKAALVALIFMHLWHDERFNLVVLGGSLLFVAIFMAFTLIDPLTRGAVNREETEMLAPQMDRPGAAVSPSELTSKTQQLREQYRKEHGDHGHGADRGSQH